MGYIEDSLMQGEKIIYEAKLHYFMYWKPVVLAILAIVVLFLPIEDAMKWKLICSGILLLLAIIWAFVVNNGKRYIVTNKRVIEKTGIIRRQSVELMLRKCESVQVNQSIAGRIFGYGDVIVTTGEDSSVYEYIWHPVKFSTQINQQIDYINMNTPVAKEVPADEELKDLTPKK